MAKVKIQGHASGTGILTVTAPNTSTDRTITLPDDTGTLISSTHTGDLTLDVSGDIILDADGGDIFLKDGGTQFGTLRQQNGDLTIGTGDTAIRFHDGDNSIYTVNATTGAKLDGAVDLGEAAGRYKDLYLSGGLKVGGTGTANALDDYEEGTHTPTITMGSGTATFYSSNNTLAYTKIGRVVHISGQVRIENTNSASGSFQISMPFTVLSGNAGLSAGNYRTYNVDTPDAGVQAVIYSEGGQAKATLEWSRDSIGSTEERATANGYYLIGLTYFV